MTIAIKFLLFTVFFTLASALFPSNILSTIGVPLETIGAYLHDVGGYVAGLAKFGDLFMTAGSSLLMMKTIILTIMFYIQFKIFYAIVKLIFY